MAFVPRIIERLYWGETERSVTQFQATGCRGAFRRMAFAWRRILAFLVIGRSFLPPHV